MGRAIIHQPWKTSAQVEFLAARGNGSVSICFGEGHDFKGCGKNSPLHLILGGAALQRCGKSFALNPASAAGGNASFQIVPRPRRGNGGKRFSSVLLSASVNEFPMNQFPMTV
jgi:hypothetical protein